ncbi:MAG: N-acetylmuramoyl-L-alanine amidase [Mariniphaga sp.]|nr:N-acetylmuramoyl-L-alanine amidase [Mariniphaga sp.]
MAMNKTTLGKNNSLLSGHMYKIPVDAEIVETDSKPDGTVIRTYEIFGDEYKDVAITSNDLSGAVYYLVAGHGGPDPGAMGKYGSHSLCEDEYAYDVTLRLARNLIEKGAAVYMITRDPNDGIRDDEFLKPDKDERCYPNLKIPLNQNSRLRQRKNAVNNLYLKNKNKFQRMIAVHVDSRSQGENIDVFYYYDKRSKTGLKAAKILQQTFDQKYNENQPGRGYHGTVSSRGLYMVRNTYPPAVYIELGNINHARDQKRFIVTDNRRALANWLTVGLVKDFQTNK